LAKEQEAIEDLNIPEDEKLAMEEKLEDNLLDNVDDEIIEAVQGNDTIDNIGDLQNVVETYSEKLIAIESLDQSEETLDELKSDLNKDVLEAVIDIYQPNDNGEVQNRTDQVLEKLELEQQFVQDLESVQVMDEEHEKEVEANLEYNALTDIAESVLDIKDQALEDSKKDIEEVVEYKEDLIENENKMIVPTETEHDIVEEAVEVLEPNDELVSDISR
jgi:hypothetical protein